MSTTATPFFLPFGATERRIYLSGPMSGYPEYNYPAFHQAAAALREWGYSVCSPAETSDWLGELSHEDYLRFDIARVLEADEIRTLPGWERSQGALAEIYTAIRIGTPVLDMHKPGIVTEDDVLSALSLIHSGHVKTTTTTERSAS